MNVVTNIILTFILLTNIVLLCGLFLAYKAGYRLYGAVVAFITPEKENESSRLALVAQAFSDMVSRSVVAQVKSSLMGKESGNVRAERALQGDIAVDLVSQSALGSILSSFPSLRKSLKRNPQLLDMAMGLLANRVGGGYPTGSSVGNGDKPKFSL